MKNGDACGARIRRRRQNQKGNTMNTQDAVNRNENGTPTVHVYDKSQPCVSPELLAETAYCLMRHQKMPQEAVEFMVPLAVAGHLKAAICLLDDTTFQNMSHAECLAVSDRINNAARMDDPYALYIVGRCLFTSGERDESLRLLEKAATFGVLDSLWFLVSGFGLEDPSRSAEYLRRAIDSGFPPAVESCGVYLVTSEALQKELKIKYGEEIRTLQEKANSFGNQVDTLSEENNHLNRKNEALRAEYHKRLADCNNEIERLQRRCTTAEAHIASLTAESLRDEAIAQLKNTISGLEDQVLEAQCGQEKAFAEKTKAERFADDLIRRNKHLVGLLRKSRIAFNEYESSSSTEDQTHE